MKLLWAILKFFTIILRCSWKWREQKENFMSSYILYLCLRYARVRVLWCEFFAFFHSITFSRSKLRWEAQKNEEFRWWKKRFVKVFIPSILTYIRLRSLRGRDFWWCCKQLHNGAHVCVFINLTQFLQFLDSF